MSERPRICLIDDEDSVREALTLGLVDAGYDVVPAADARAAFDLIGRERFDAVVSDMNMPGFSGAELIAALRQQQPRLPIIAISGGGQIDGQSVDAAARACGATACLVKPFRGRDIAAALATALA